MRRSIFIVFPLIGALVFPAFGAEELSLDRAIELAVANNEDLKKAGEDKLIARERVKEARGAVIPKISGSYSYSYTIDMEYPSSMMGGGTNGAGGEYQAQAAQYSGGSAASSMSLGLLGLTDHSHTFSLTASQTLFTSGRVMNFYRAATAGSSAADLSYTRKKRDLALQVQEAYLNSLMTREVLEIARASLENTRGDHEIILQRYREGLGSEFEVMQHEVELNNRRTGLITAENNYTLAKNYLKVITGIELETDLTLTDSYNESFPRLEFEKILNAMLENEPSLQALEEVTNVNRYLWKAYKADYFPLVAAFGNATYMGYSNDLVPGSDDFGHSYLAGINVSIPIYEGGVKNAQKNLAFRDYNKSKLDLAKVRKLLTIDLQNAYLAYLASQREMESAKSTVSLATKAYELAQLRYKTGLGSLTELQDAELAFTEAKLFLSKTLRDVNLHLYKIRSYLPEDARSTS